MANIVQPMYNRNAAAIHKNRVPGVYSNSAQRPVPKNTMGTEGVSMEGSGSGILKTSDDSPIYDGEIGKEMPVFSFDRTDMIKGLIFSEILAKPKCKRTGR